MEPLTTASIIWSGISAVVGGVLGNRTDAGVVLSYRTLRATLEQYRPDGNYDLERAIYRAYLQASIHTLLHHYGQLGYDAAGWVRWEILPQWLANLVRRWRSQPYLGKTYEAERQWIDTTLPLVRHALVSADQAQSLTDLGLSSDLTAVRQQYLLLLRPPEGEGHIPDLRASLLEQVLTDLEQRTPGMPDGVAKALRAHWFDLFCGCFQALFKSDDKDAALTSYAEALRLFTEVGAKLGQANVLLAQGRLLDDTSLLEQALELYEKIRDGYSIARCKYFLAILWLQRGDGKRGVRLLQEARELWEQIDFTPGIEAIEGILRQRS